MFGNLGLNYLLCCIVVFELVGCSSTKKRKAPLEAPLVIVQENRIPSAPIVEDKIIKDTITVLQYEDQAWDPYSHGLFQSLSPEQRTQEQYTTGIHRQYGFAPTMHYDIRKPQFVMIHHTSQNSLAQTIRTFQLEHTQVSSHYVIGRDGEVIQMLNDYMRSWHAGAGKWGNITDMNSVSIGIELDNNGREPFPDAQINALLILLDTLKSKHRIPQRNFIGHSDYAPARKNDPSTFFPWKVLAERGFGIWYNESYLEAPPPTFNTTDGLRIIGYDTSSNLRAVIRSFKEKYIRTDTSKELTPFDVMVIYDLYKKHY